MAEVPGSFSYFNVLIGLVLVEMPWLAEASTIIHVTSSSLAGLIIMALSFSKGKIKKYGITDKYGVKRILREHGRVIPGNKKRLNQLLA